MTRPYALDHISIINPVSTALTRARVDTGSDDTVFPEPLPQRIGIDLTNAPTSQFTGVGPSPVPVRYAEVSLRLAGNGELHEWAGRVGFTATPMRWPLLGYAGFLEFFTATFHGDLEELELATNTRYSGT
jgi:hypothetical protein